MTCSDPAVDFVEEIDGIAHRSIKNIAAAIELLGYDTKVLCQSFSIIAEMNIMVKCYILFIPT